MSSLYSRPDSPPPRQPSPELLPAPLPCPHLARRVASQPKIRIHSPALPPGLHPRTKTIQSARSCDFLGDRSSSLDTDRRTSFRSDRKGARRSIVTSTFTTSSVTSSPATSPAPSRRSTPDFVPQHRRTLSVAYSASPPLSPSPRAAPPVPSVPHRYTGPKHIICPKPVSLKPIDLTVLEEQPNRVHMPFPPLPLQLPREEQPKPTLPPLERHKSMGMACLKFFRMGRSPPRQPQNRVAAM